MFGFGDRLGRFVLALGLLAALRAFPGIGEAQERLLRVGVAQGVSSGILEGQGWAQGADGRRVALAGRADVVHQGGALYLRGETLPLPVRVEGEGLRWGPTGYRGSLCLIPASRGFTVVNEVDLESYLRGVLKMEANPAWPQEALKAQAIIARTFAVKSQGRHRAQGFDLCALPHCQAYRGRNAEDPATDRAVAATRGQILVYGGVPASTFYHADSGGVTADASQVWGGRVSYLVSRGEPVSYTSPYSSWQTVLTAEQLERVLGKMGQNVGRVRSLRAASRDSGGRVVLLEVTGDRGTVRVKGHAFRMAAGSSLVKSTRFEIRGDQGGETPLPPNLPPQPVVPVSRPSSQEDVLVQLTEQGVFSKEELMDMLLHPEKRKAYQDLGLSRKGEPNPVRPATPLPVTPASPRTAPTWNAAGGDRFVLEGRGWGHGVGLSQWGAKALAEQGWSCPRILEHYFPGTSLCTLP